VHLCLTLPLWVIFIILVVIDTTQWWLQINEISIWIDPVCPYFQDFDLKLHRGDNIDGNFALIIWLLQFLKSNVQLYYQVLHKLIKFFSIHFLSKSSKKYENNDKDITSVLFFSLFAKLVFIQEYDSCTDHKRLY
jgi:hypothetical protein